MSGLLSASSLSPAKIETSAGSVYRFEILALAQTLDVTPDGLLDLSAAGGLVGATRKPDASTGLSYHRDLGSQYASGKYRQAPRELRDKAVMESFSIWLSVGIY